MSSTTSTTPTTLTTGRSYDAPVSIGALGAWTTHTVKRAATEASNYVLAEIERQDLARQVKEDSRANHRNLNRMLTLFGALVIGLCLTWCFTHPAVFAPLGVSPKTIGAIEPYTFVITFMLDSSLAAYSLIRKY